MRTATLLTLLTLTACATAPEASKPIAPGSTPGPDLEMMEGHSAAEHMEVSQGVYLLPGAVERGIQYTPGEVPAAPEADVDKQTASASYCYEYDSDVYYDTTQHGTTFDGDPTWYGSVSAVSYESAWGRSDYVSVYGYTWTPSEVDYVATYGYVYIDGVYVGYLETVGSWDGFASTSGYFTGTCGGATSEVTVRISHYAYDYGDSGDWLDFESFSLVKGLRAEVNCCP